LPVDKKWKQREDAAMWRKEDVIAKLQEEQGSRSLRAYAAAIGCSASCLCKVYAGKRDPGPRLLGHLGLERKESVTVTYRKRRWR
jgi:hypothetical protein